MKKNDNKEKKVRSRLKQCGGSKDISFTKAISKCGLEFDSGDEVEITVIGRHNAHVQKVKTVPVED